MIIAGIGNLLAGKITFLSIALTFFGVYWFAIRPFETRWATRRQFAKRPDKDIDVEWVIASDQLKTKSAHGRSEFTWDAIAKVVTTPDGLLIYPNDQIFHWLPRTAFAESSESDQVAKLAQTKVDRFYDIA